MGKTNDNLRKRKRGASICGSSEYVLLASLGQQRQFDRVIGSWNAIGATNRSLRRRLAERVLYCPGRELVRRWYWWK